MGALQMILNGVRSLPFRAELVLLIQDDLAGIISLLPGLVSIHNDVHAVAHHDTKRKDHRPV